MIRILPFSEDDFPGLISWIRSPELLIQWAGPAQFTFPLSEGQLREYLAESIRVSGSRKIFKALGDAGETVGHIEIGAINRQQQTASLCRIFIAPEHRGKGLCARVVREALAIGFRDLGLRRIELRVFGFNTAAIRCYEEAGFVKEGVLRRSVVVGARCWDTVMMAILREEWENLALVKRGVSDVSG